MERQKIINEEAMKRLIKEQRELDESTKQRIKIEEEWLQRRLEIETKSTKQILQGNDNTPQTVKLQKYKITPFSGDFKDWVRFWNQFSVEVNRSTISKISKFNYFLELTKSKPRYDILGLPHTTDVYAEVKRILAETYGKDFKVHRALVKELENLHTITNIHKIASIHEFYNKLQES